MEVNNTFDAGMNSDASKLRQPATTYPKAMNFRPISDAGSSVGALTNIRGNECAITFPAIRGVYNLKFKYHEEGNYTGVLNITINGQTTTNITITTGTSVSELIPYIEALTNCYSNPLAVNPTFAVAYNDDSLVIYQLPEYSSCDPALSVEPNITITTVSGSPELLFTTHDGGEYPWITAYVPAYTGIPVVIGSTFINEDIYLFTCPASNAVGSGQIWLLQFNEITKVSTIKLIYNSILNFSINCPIAPSAALGRYELNNLQRIYWTDFNNPVRTINVKDSNIMALAPELVDMISAIKFSVPILTDVIAGQSDNPVNTGATYQAAYRLVKSNGAVTAYSMPSNLVYPLPFDTHTFTDASGNFAKIEGTAPPIPIDKAFEFTVEGIDTNYDKIEFVIIERAWPNEDTYTCYKYEEQLINGNSTIVSLFTNPSDKEEITLQEFLLEGSSFSHCKTLESKDNRLFFGNIKDPLVEYLDDYDTRTYRFDNSSSTGGVLRYEADTAVSTVNKVGTQYLLNVTSPIEEKYDMIPVYNLDMGNNVLLGENPLYQPTKYQANSTIVGGEGPNISYKFGAVLMCADREIARPVSSPIGTFGAGTNRDLNYSAAPIVNPYVQGYRRPGAHDQDATIRFFNNGAPYQPYVSPVTGSMAMEYNAGTFKSYQHNEIYRFAIVFKSKTGKASFAKWIGDIKFPNYGDPIAPGLEPTTNTGATVNRFISMMGDYNDNSSFYSVIPYINFDVTIPDDLKNLIDGYEIVRVKREKNDRYVKAHGMLHTETNAYIHWNFQRYPNKTYGPQISFDAFTPIVDGFNGGNPDLSATDKISLTEVYGYSAALVSTDITTPDASIMDQHRLLKYYYHLNSLETNTAVQATSVTRFAVHNQIYLPSAQTGAGYNNVSADGYSVGSPTIFMTLDSGSFYNEEIYLGVPFNQNTRNKILAIHYDPNRLETQYGGRKYADRASNEYISTGALYPIDINSPTNTSIKVFGGDIYHSIVDVHKAIKQWGQFPASPTASTDKRSTTAFFPVQSTFNPDLRRGNHVNTSLNTNGANADTWEDYEMSYQSTYENTVRTFYPKPLFFNGTSEWNNRVQWSIVKVNGETTDSWSNIPALNFYDVEGAYGGINAFSILNNNLYFIQDRAIGYLYINPITTITGANGLPVTLGKGSTVEKHEYLSIDAGTKHQWSVFRSNSAITFIDSRHKKIYLFNGQSLVPISDVKGAKGFINKVLHDDILINDNPIIGKGILVTYDHFNNEFLYTFRNSFTNTELADPNLLDDEGTYEVYTLVYSDLIGAFSSFYDFTPYIYINNRNKLFSIKDLASRSIYMHNVGNYSTFYGTTFPSCVSSVINPNPLNTKVFDNISWISQSVKESVKWKDEVNDYLGDSDDVPYLDDTVTRFRCYDEYQNSDWLTLAQTNPITNLRRSEQGWNIQVPRNKVNYDSTAIDTKSIFDPTILTKVTFGDRMRDKYLTVDLEYDNSLNNRFIIHNIKTTYRISDR